MRLARTTGTTHGTEDSRIPISFNLSGLADSAALSATWHVSSRACLANSTSKDSPGVSVAMPDLQVLLTVVGLPSVSKSSLLFDGLDWRENHQLAIIEGRETWVKIVARDREGLEIKRSDKVFDIAVSGPGLGLGKTMHLIRTSSQHGYAAVLPQLPAGEYSLMVKQAFGYDVDASGNSSLPLAEGKLLFKVLAQEDRVQSA